jgi:hypothetical protein
MTCLRETFGPQLFEIELGLGMYCLEAKDGLEPADDGVGVVAIEFDAIPVAASATLRTQREPPAGLKAANVMVECHVRV